MPYEYLILPIKHDKVGALYTPTFTRCITLGKVPELSVLRVVLNYHTVWIFLGVNRVQSPALQAQCVHWLGSWASSCPCLGFKFLLCELKGLIPMSSKALWSKDSIVHFTGDFWPCYLMNYSPRIADTKDALILLRLLPYYFFLPADSKHFLLSYLSSVIPFCWGNQRYFSLERVEQRLHRILPKPCCLCLIWFPECFHLSLFEPHYSPREAHQFLVSPFLLSSWAMTLFWPKSSSATSLQSILPPFLLSCCCLIPGLNFQVSFSPVFLKAGYTLEHLDA